MTLALTGKNVVKSGYLGNTNSRIHGEAVSQTSEYNAWRSMRLRCLCKTHKFYNYYGGRGIKICDRWLEPKGCGYFNFLQDLGRKPSKKYSLDRIDNNGNYTPSNCRWATSKTQMKNRRPYSTWNFN